MTQFFTQESISSRVEEIISKQIGNTSTLSPETRLQDDLDLDSLELVELGITLEKEFGVSLPNAAVRRCVTLNDVIQLVLHAESGKKVGNL